MRHRCLAVTWVRDFVGRVRPTFSFGVRSRDIIRISVDVRVRVRVRMLLWSDYG